MKLNNMKIITKTFDQLTTSEIYDILQLRTEIFVVEQDCVYQDMDGKDQIALHVIGLKENKIIAYTRCFKPGDYFEEASIGRVVVAKSQRKHNYGNLIMIASIKAIKKHFNTRVIKLSAQCYLNKFYSNLGFKDVGNKYLEDGIPHIAMIKD
jgi:ElaA protein